MIAVPQEHIRKLLEAKEKGEKRCTMLERQLAEIQAQSRQQLAKKSAEIRQLTSELAESAEMVKLYKTKSKSLSDEVNSLRRQLLARPASSVTRGPAPRTAPNSAPKPSYYRKSPSLESLDNKRKSSYGYGDGYKPRSRSPSPTPPAAVSRSAVSSGTRHREPSPRQSPRLQSSPYAKTNKGTRSRSPSPGLDISTERHSRRPKPSTPSMNDIDAKLVALQQFLRDVRT